MSRSIGGAGFYCSPEEGARDCLDRKCIFLKYNIRPREGAFYFAGYWIFSKWASGPFLFYGVLCMSKRITLLLEELFEPVVSGLGYEYVGVEYLPQGARSMLRVYIDAAEGVNVDDCATVSHQISGVLDVEDPISTQYVLEVSSPGLDRPLFKLADYKKFENKVIDVKLVVPLNGRRRFKGVINASDEENIIINVDGENFEIPFIQIEKARLVPKIF